MNFNVFINNSVTFKQFSSMKHLLLLLSVVFSCLFSTVSLAQTTKNVSKSDALAIAQRQFAGKDVDYYILSNNHSARKHNTIKKSNDFNSMDITSHAGNLAKVLGDNIYNVDSLVVRGTVDAADIRTLWDASFKGRLSVINLENAEIENGIVPEDAFWHQKEQLDPSGEFINTIHLRRIILPDGVKRIEEGAFAYCINLEEINIPSSLQYLGTYAFSDCVSLKTDPLIFPEGFERFGQLVFSDCSSLTGKVVLPSTIKEIDDGAFFRSKITSINLPEGLERIGLAAFYACRLEEIWIPNSCQDLSSPTLFQQNYFLKRIHLPEGLDRIPNGFADACFKPIVR